MRAFKISKVKKPVSSMSKIIRVVYENGVFKPMERVDIKEGTKLKIKIEGDIKKLRGKYKSLKPDLLTLRDEIYDKRTHILR